MVDKIKAGQQAAASITRLIGTPSFADAFKRAKGSTVHNQQNRSTSLALLWATTEALTVTGEAAVLAANLLLWDVPLLRQIDEKERLLLIEKLFKNLERFNGWHQTIKDAGLTLPQIAELIAKRLREEDTHPPATLKEGSRRQAFYGELTKKPSVYAAHFSKNDLMDVIVVLRRQMPGDNPDLVSVMTATWERRYGHPFMG
jgi:hypothetical protein